MKQTCLKRKDNLWILFNGSEYVIGLTNEAQEELGDITFADLPIVNQEVKQGEILLEVEAEKAVNEKIDADITVLNDSDEMNAWLISLKNVSEEEFQAL